MSNYCLQINGKISLSDYSSIRDYMYIVSENDKFTICINNNEKKEANLICSMLGKYKFNILSKEYNKDGTYHISSVKER